MVCHLLPPPLLPSFLLPPSSPSHLLRPCIMVLDSLGVKRIGIVKRIRELVPVVTSMFDGLCVVAPSVHTTT